MKLSNLTKRGLICLNLKSTEKMDVIKEMVDILVQTGQITDRKIFLESVLKRERLDSTGIGQGVAIPHARTEIVKEITITFGRSQKGINFESLDGGPVHLIFLIASPPKDSGLYLRILARLSSLLRKKKVRESLREAKTADEVISLLSCFEEEIKSTFEG